MGGKKSGGGFLGAGGKSGFLNTGLFSSGPDKIGGYDMSKEAKAAEIESINRQRAIANGTAPSISQMTMNRNVDQINQQAMSLAASQRGVSNPALAMRQAQLSAQQAGLEAAQQGAILGEQERRSADQFLVNQANAQRGVAFQQDQANISNSLASQKQQAEMISGIGQVAAKSDKDAKENIKEENNVSKAIEQFTSAIKGYEFEYKNKSDGTGKKVGVMAQDLEKSKIGKTIVDEDENGDKVINTNKAIGALLAATAEMNKKIEKLSKKA
jgi:hypothetical protein